MDDRKGEIAGLAGTRDSDKPHTEHQKTNDRIPPELEEKIEEVLEVVPPEQRARAHALVRGVVEDATLFKGPLPPPAMLREYEAIIPGCANRMLAMAELEQRQYHRYRSWTQMNISLGLTAAFLVSIGLVSGAVYCASIGAMGAALALTGASAMGMVPALVRGGRQLLSPDQDLHSWKLGTPIKKPDKAPKRNGLPPA
jgi:uncharacterized membrane protein